MMDSEQIFRWHEKAALAATCLVAAGCGSNDATTPASTAGTSSTTQRAASGPSSCPPVDANGTNTVVVRNQIDWPVVTRVTDWSCSYNEGRFQYSGDTSPGGLDNIRLEPGSEATRTISSRWTSRGKQDMEGDVYWWLGRFDFALYQEIGGRVRPIPMRGGFSTTMALNVKLGKMGPTRWGIRPVSKPWVACPVTFPTTLAGGERAQITIACPNDRDQRTTTTITVSKG